ncbi:unnamed protein product [Lactuca virosa]|uniref:Pentatricopeptide repeat-containing protein n=1 Tax=Lactuca virosa TaxID=75947 RepID=A0AAU9PH97_9ASTR|nr:unnamed protein product [Lactuca virosa]
MEGTFLPNRPALPLQLTKPTQSTQQQRLGFNPTTLPPQPPSPQSFPIDPLVQHLIHLSSPPPTATHKQKPIRSVKSSNTHIEFPATRSYSKKHSPNRTHFRKPYSSSLLTLEDPKVQLAGIDGDGDGSLDFLSIECKSMLDSILEQTSSSLHLFFYSVKFKLIELDLVSLLKGLDRSGNWEKALSLFEWVLEDSRTNQSFNIDNQMIELMVKILGRESQHTIMSKLFDKYGVGDYSLDVRAFTTIIHSHSCTGKV